MGKPWRVRKDLVAFIASGLAVAGTVALAVVGEIPVQREGQPVPGATVTLFGPKGEQVGEGRTDERGVAVIPDLPRRPDELVVAAAEDGAVALRPPRMPETPGRPAAVDLDGEAVRPCLTPNPFEPIVVGPKNDVGAGLAKTVERFLPGIGLPGGAVAGIGTGGNVDVAASEPDEEPPTTKDPFPRDARHRLRDPKTGVEVLVGAMFDDRGRLLVGVEIDKAPAKGTLHAVALLSPHGDLVPWTDWRIYKLWREWWLTVSWTKVTEHYVDGALVNRTVEHGGWTERWREDLGTFAVPVETKATMPLWRMAGFDRATGGVRSAGFSYPVTPAMLQAAPFLFVAHVTLPDRDPVVTVPFVFALWVNPLAPIGGANPVVFVPLGPAPFVALALDPAGAHRLLAAHTGTLLLGALMEPGDMMTKVTQALAAGTWMLAYGCSAAAQASWLLPYDARPGESAEERERRRKREEEEDDDIGLAPKDDDFP